MNAVDTFRANVSRLLAQRGITALAFARAIENKSTAWASMLLTGRRDTTMKTAEKVAAFFGVPLWRLLIDVDDLRAIETRSTNLPRFVELPWLKAPVGAGPLLIDGDEMRDEGLAFSERFALEHPGAICLTVGRGQWSMTPTIQPGDIVVIDPALDRRRQPRPGDIQAVNFAPLSTENRGAIKRVELRDGHLIISSDNPDKREYPTEVFDVEGVDLLEVMKGQVVWFGRILGEKRKR